MPLEATIICADNSEWMRNGDYIPTRFEAEKDAVRMIARSKCNQNRESAVGLITMAGKSPEVLVTLTPDAGKLSSILHSITIANKCDVLATLRIAQLALKHRQNKQQHQRVILFIGSPIDCDKKDLVHIGKLLKKSNVAVDIVSFGEPLENSEKLDEFINAVNNNNNSHLIMVPPGSHALSEAIMASPIGGGGGGGDDFQDGAIPNLGGEGFGAGEDLDAEDQFRMAIQMSLMEYQQQSAQATRTESPSSASEPAPSTNTATNTSNPSMDVENSSTTSTPATTTQPATHDEVAESVEMLDDSGEDADEIGGSFNELSEEEQIRLALEMSLQTAQEEGVDTAAAAAVADEPSTPAAASQTASTTSSEPATPSTPAVSGTPTSVAAPKKEDTRPSVISEINDNYVNSLFEGLPGVDPNDPSIQSVLAALKGETPSSSSSNNNDKKDESKQ